MTDYLDHLLDELVPAERDTGSWSDVLDRARRSRRRYTAALAVVAALVLAPAAWAAVNAFEGTPAPQVIQQNFSPYNRVAINPTTGSILDLLPAADAGKAHGVLQLQTSDGPLDLWAAPETDGSGTCWFVGWEADIGTDHAIGTGSCTTGNDAAIAPETYNDANHPAYTVLVGSVTGSETTLDVTLTDGSTTTLPVAEHLFLGALPPGSRLASITGRDAAGDIVASWTGPSS
ncbi:MAG TPA: hypothetical protein VE088_00125 [Gaiellaceae bacterium]|nr:hypothetical protein [Gaiellaceae bacterium]